MDIIFCQILLKRESLIIYAIFYHLLDYYTVKIVNMQAEKGEKRAEVQKVKLNRRKKEI